MVDYADQKETQPKASDDFRLKEFELLRKEIEYRTAGQERVERNVILALILTYAWLALLDTGRLQPPIKAIYPYLWWLPFLIVVLGAARFWDDHMVIARIGAYIARQEKLVEPDKGFWENSPEHWSRVRWGPATPLLLRKAIWLLLTLGTGTFAIYGML